jgi:hypothetical protein
MTTQTHGDPGVITHRAGGGAGRYRWVVCALLFLATKLKLIDRQILSLL